jgi:hypothetical protein
MRAPGVATHAFGSGALYGAIRVGPAAMRIAGADAATPFSDADGATHF